MHGSILVLAKKKAAGPGAYFDPMGEQAGMASGPMMFEMAPEEGGEEEDEEMRASTKPQLAGMNFREAADKLREIADALQKSSSMHAGQAETLNDIADQGGPEEEEPEEEEEEKAPKAKTKKPFPGFGSKKEMKY